MARYICLTCEPHVHMKTYRDVVSHLKLIPHGVLTSWNSYLYSDQLTASKLPPHVRRLGRCECPEFQRGFKNFREMIKHIHDVHEVTIIYQKKVLTEKPTVFLDGIPTEQATQIFNKKMSISEGLRKILERDSLSPLEKQIIDLSESIVRQYRTATGKRDTTSIRASALYIASIWMGEPFTQRAIAEAFEITEVTIRQNYRKIQKLPIDLTISL